MPKNKISILQKSREGLKKLLSNILSEAISKIAADILIGAGIPIALLVSFWDTVLDLAVEVLKLLKIEMPLYVPILWGSTILLSYYIYNRYIKQKPFFIEYEKLLWEIDAKTGNVYDFPFCPEHQAELVADSFGSYYCPIDGKRHYQELKTDMIYTLWCGAKSIAKAKRKGTLIKKEV